MADHLDHNDEMIDFDEACEIQHINYLIEFKDKVWPIYQAQGFTLGEAFFAWKFNVLKNTVDELIEEMRETRL